jgi:hypothetical protein
LKRRSNSSRDSARDLILAVTAARNEAAAADLTGLLLADASYWDCLHGNVSGPKRIALLLCDPLAGRDAQLTVETLVAEDDRAVVELRVRATAPGPAIELRRTEVYGLQEGGIAWCRAYFDPAELPGGTGRGRDER